MINAAVIGLGRWGQSIVRSTQGKSQRLRFIRGVSKEPELVADFARTQGFDLSTEFEEAVADPRVQAVFLATPHSLHVRQIETPWRRPASRSGARSPWRSRAPRPRAPSTACRKAGVPFALGNNKRCFASMRELKRVVADGVIGEVLHVEGHFTNEHSTRVKGGWRDDPSKSPGGGMTGAGLHLIDALVNLGRADRARSTRACSRARRRPIRATPPPRWCVRERRDRADRDGARGSDLSGACMCSAPRAGRRRATKPCSRVARIGEEPKTQIFPQVNSLGVLLGSLRRDDRDRKAVPGLDR